MSHDICHPRTLEHTIYSSTIKPMTRFPFLALIVLILLAVSPLTVQGQEGTPEPTVTPTPAYVAEQPLTSGAVLRVERTITYGDAAVVIMLLIVWITVILTQAIRIPRSFTQR